MSRGRAIGLALLALVVLTGCGREPAPAPTPNADDRPTPLVESDLGGGPSTLPDLRSYVVGSLPEPNVPGRDPFVTRGRPRRAPAPAEPLDPDAPDPLELRGIVRSQGRWVALLAVGSVGIGESVVGWTVISIDDRSVLLRRGAERRRLSL